MPAEFYFSISLYSLKAKLQSSVENRVSPLTSGGI